MCKIKQTTDRLKIEFEDALKEIQRIYTEYSTVNHIDAIHYVYEKLLKHGKDYKQYFKY